MSSLFYKWEFWDNERFSNLPKKAGANNCWAKMHIRKGEATAHAFSDLEHTWEVSAFLKSDTAIPGDLSGYVKAQDKQSHPWYHYFIGKYEISFIVKWTTSILY